MTTIAAIEVESDTFYQRYLAGLCDCFKVWKKFMDWPYLIFALSNFILYAWYDVMYVYLYNYAETDLKLPPNDATKFLSVIGILNTLGELVIGWLGDRPNVNLNVLYAVCMIVCGGSTALVPFLSNYYALCCMAGLYGLCISANYALTSPILVNLVSLEQFSNAYGFLLLVQGVSNLIGPPFAGFLYDVYKIWHYTFGLGGLFIVFSGLMLLILPCLRKVKLMRNQHLNHQNHKGQVKAKQDKNTISNGNPAYV
jgi:MFS family permease